MSWSDTVNINNDLLYQWNSVTITLKNILILRIKSMSLVFLFYSQGKEEMLVDWEPCPVWYIFSCFSASLPTRENNHMKYRCDATVNRCDATVNRCDTTSEAILPLVSFLLPLLQLKQVRNICIIQNGGGPL